MNDTSRSIDILRSVSYLDSALFGFSVDIFKVRILIRSGLSAGLDAFGFDEDLDYLCCDFRQIRNFDLVLGTSEFGPPYVEEGEMAGVDLASLPADFPNIVKVGVTDRTNVIDVYGEFKDVYRISVDTRIGKIAFEFADLKITRFDPEKLDASD